jgi:hypothetical protein
MMKKRSGSLRNFAASRTASAHRVNTRRDATADAEPNMFDKGLTKKTRSPCHENSVSVSEEWLSS